MKRIVRLRPGRRRLLPDRADPESPDAWLSLEYVHEQVLAQLAAQSDTWDVVDGRLRLILGFIGIVFAAAVGLQRGPSPAVAQGVAIEPPLLPFWVGALTIGAVFVYLAAGAIVAWVYWPTNFDRPPRPSSLRDQYLTTDPRETRLIVVDSIIEAYNRNESVLARKTFAFKVAFVLTSLATALMGSAVTAQIALQTRAWG